MDRGLAWPVRVAVWDAALTAVRAVLRAAGLREVSTPIRSPEVALEPWIEPLQAQGQFLATSPELAMKRLLARGGGSMFQIAHVFRAAELGARHREEFHLVEWYRAPGALDEIIADVERVIAAVFEAVGPIVGRPVPPPRSWRRVALLDLLRDTLGVELRGDEPAADLIGLLRRVRHEAGVALPERDDDDLGEGDPELARLQAWTELFSLWSDQHLDPWLAAQPAELGFHVVGFPAPLAALAQLDADGRTGGRFESHVGGVELANGYRELRDPIEQRRRFELVAGLRARHGLAPLPMPERFLAELGRLPVCAGVALGLDRLVTLACGCERLDHVALAD